MSFKIKKSSVSTQPGRSQARLLSSLVLSVGVIIVTSYGLYLSGFYKPNCASFQDRAWELHARRDDAALLKLYKSNQTACSSAYALVKQPNKDTHRTAVDKVELYRYISFAALSAKDDRLSKSSATKGLEVYSKISPRQKKIYFSPPSVVLTDLRALAGGEY